VAELTDPWFVLFVASQSLYLVVNLAALVLLYARETNLVDEVASGVHRPIHVLVPVRGERRDVLAETLDGIFAQAYPDALTHVYVVYEADDAAVESYLDSFLDEQRERGRDVVPRRVDREALSFYLDASGQLTQGSLLPRTKAAALVYAFVSLTFERDDVITVFDSDTQVPSDTFALAVGGLEEYDIVQAKQTVRNIGDGWLPRLESMGIAAWSHVVYAHTSRGPYQLLGKGYFVEAETLYDLGNWNATEVTEDMALGVAAYVNGYRLGVLDRYVQDLCPSRFDAWVRQKTRWVRGPYSYLLADALDGVDRVRFGAFTMANQLVSLTNLVGVPAGAFVLYASLAGDVLWTNPVLDVVVAVNLAFWIYYSARGYAATRKAVEFESRRERLVYYLLSNPVTQVAYATIWTVPILYAVRQAIRGEQPTFEVTPK
jgi:cellulose synthase/poly-beta-1,6-N-acetylglucosamine synthase-like glycosyltransferase